MMPDNASYFHAAYAAAAAAYALYALVLWRRAAGLRARRAALEQRQGEAAARRL